MKIIAHRGASGYAPENSKSAFLKALDLNADGIECDLQLTKDEQIVIIHDRSVDRTSNGKGLVKEKTLKELQQLDIGKWYSDDFAKEQIITLDELLDLCPTDKILNLEIKIRFGIHDNIEQKVVNVLKKHNTLDNIVISSFDHETIKTINELNSKIKVGLLMSENLLNLPEYIKYNNLKIYSIHNNYESVTEKCLKDLKANGLKSYTWTVNEKNDMDQLNSMGVDGIITNYPDRY